MDIDPACDAVDRLSSTSRKDYFKQFGYCIYTIYLFNQLHGDKRALLFPKARPRHAFSISCPAAYPVYRLLIPLQFLPGPIPSLLFQYECPNNLPGYKASIKHMSMCDKQCPLRANHSNTAIPVC